jgi:5'-methylthioadenosine phosphorylase
MELRKIGIIGGTGLENTDFLEFTDAVEFSNKNGEVSSKISRGKIGEIEVFIISRHGRNHEFSPSNINYKANIMALKDLGCDAILALTACGSLQEQYKPGDFFFPDQFIDWTKNRQNTIFDGANVVHTPMNEPFSEFLRFNLEKACKELCFDHQVGGNIITIEGPRFSSKAESLLFRSFGCDIINMTTSTECILANELEIPYQSIAMVTDYDCWKDSEEPVSMDAILEVMKENSIKAITLIKRTLEILGR